MMRLVTWVVALRFCGSQPLDHDDDDDSSTVWESRKPQPLKQWARDWKPDIFTLGFEWKRFNFWLKTQPCSTLIIPEAQILMAQKKKWLFPHQRPLIRLLSPSSIPSPSFWQHLAISQKAKQKTNHFFSIQQNRYYNPTSDCLNGRTHAGSWSLIPFEIKTDNSTSVGSAVS